MLTLTATDIAMASEHLFYYYTNRVNKRLFDFGFLTLMSATGCRLQLKYTNKLHNHRTYTMFRDNFNENTARRALTQQS